jgi:hypothetical protein
MSQILDEVLAANDHYAKSFGHKAQLALPPARHFAILTCMDARLDPAKYAGLAEGDAHVIRNAGGRASDDAIRSLVISYKLQVAYHHQSSPERNRRCEAHSKSSTGTRLHFDLRLYLRREIGPAHCRERCSFVRTEHPREFRTFIRGRLSLASRKRDHPLRAHREDLFPLSRDNQIAAGK